MLRVIPKTSFILCIVAAIVLMPQVHVMESLAFGCADGCASMTDLMSDADCSDLDMVCCEKKDVPDESSDEGPQPCKPCDGPCDCPCCIKTVRPAPMIITSVQPVEISEVPALVLLPPNSRPGQVALSVLVQPPIV